MQPKTWRLKKTLNNRNTVLGKTNFRHQNRKFGIQENDRFSHIYAVGKTGVGKTTLLKGIIAQDIENGKGCAVFDPHGDLAEAVVELVPRHREKDLIYLNLPDPNLKLRYNPFKRVSAQKRPLVASGLLEIFKKLFTDAWGVRLEHILRNAILALLDQPSADLSDIQRLITDPRFRNQCLHTIGNESVRDFWAIEFDGYTQTAISPIQNKIGAFLANPVIKRVLVDNQEDISFRRIMDGNKILVINLSKGRIGEDASCLLGSLFLTSLGLAGFSRQDVPEKDRVGFHIVCDEFQNFTTQFLVNALSELRKYRISITLANQFLDQIKKDIRDAVLGNVGTLIVFRTGVSDAGYLSKEFDGKFSAGDITHLPNFTFYLRLMIDGRSSDGFSAKMLVAPRT